MIDSDPINIVKKTEIYPEGRVVDGIFVEKALFLIRHISDDIYSCDWCGHNQTHKPTGKTGLGPTLCPECGLSPFFVETNLIARLREDKK